MKKLLALILTAMLGTAFAKETLHIDFNKAQTVDVAGTQLKIDGTFSEDGYRATGTSGIKIPAGKLVGDDCGTIILECKFTEETLHKSTMRPILHLRTAGRATLGFQFFADMSANFRFYDHEKSWILPFEKCEVNRPYMFAYVWNGSTVRIYQDGMQIAEQPQIFSLKGNVRNIIMGPYNDGWYAPAPWEDSYHVKSISVFDTALSSSDIAKMYNIEFKPLIETNPLCITIPAVPAKMAAPNMDGQVDDECWKYAGSMPRLIRGIHPQLSGELPPHDFKLLYDNENLYLGFTSIFPRGSSIIAGNLRTDQLEPEAWGTESFEFYIENDKIYRFCGNVAGGYCEGIPGNTKWDGKWTYKTQNSMKIDDRIHWHGEVAIPWKTIGLNGAPTKPLRINFCRSWKIESIGAFTSMNVWGRGYEEDAMFKANFAPKGTAVLQVKDQNNPNNGEYEQALSIASACGGPVTYELAVAKLDGSSKPIPLCVKKWNLKAGEVIADKLTTSISYPDFDCLLYTLKHGNNIVMNEIIPFKLDENFFDLEPLFFQGKINVLLKEKIMKNKLGASFVGKINLCDANGKVMSSVSSDAKDISLSFNRDWAAGEYSVALLDAKGQVCAEKNLFYPGHGDWEKMEFPQDVILPPFAPMQSTVKGNSLKSTVSMREYSWNNSFLPQQIASCNENLFTAPAELLINGKPTAPQSFTIGMNKPHRVEYTAKADFAESKSWLEYDGVQWNELTLSNAPAGTSIALRFTLDARFAKYLHASSSAGWGAKITRALPEGETIVPFFPSLWIGNEEKGLCFFAETNKEWNVPAKRTFVINKAGDKATLTVCISEKMKPTDKITYGYGLLGTPIRPFAKNYPFDTVGWTFAAPMNRPGRRPTSAVAILCSRPGFDGGDLGTVFADIENDANSKKQAICYEKELAWCEGHNIRPYPYICGRYISNKYPEMRAYKAEWSFRPEIMLDCGDGSHLTIDCCPASTASNFMAYKAYQLLKRYPGMKGLYFDFGNVPPCSNSKHGCNGRTPLLAQREFYRRMAYIQTLVGIEEPVIEVHNTDSNLLPTYTFATHLLNGEQVRQTSSTLLHNKKDILDTYGIEMFAAELNTNSLGINNAVYMPLDTLMAKFGGDEDTEAYQFRLGKAEYAATLIHNTIINLRRNHFGMADKLIRTYDKFGVDKARFIGYWHEPVKVIGAKDIYASCYVKDNKVLVIVGHVSKSHENQTFELKLDWKKLGVTKPPKTALDTQTAPDPEYDELFKLRDKYKVPIPRAPLVLGDYGSKLIDFKGDTIKMSLNYHSFAIIELK